MSFADALNRLNDSCLSHCGGQEYAFTRVTSTDQADDPDTITGILDSGAQVEGVDAGDGTYAQLAMTGSQLSVPLEKGDEIETTTLVYKIVDIDTDGGMSKFLLRKDRAV